MERNPLLAETEQVGIILHVIACSEKKVGNRHRTKFRSSACGGKSFSAQLFSEFPERKIHYLVYRSSCRLLFAVPPSSPVHRPPRGLPSAVRGLHSFIRSPFVDGLSQPLCLRAFVVRKE
jgi:hypothetical protein